MGADPFGWGRLGGGYWCHVGLERGELMEKYSGAPCEVRISREGLLAALIICMHYVKLSRQRGELPCELSKAPQWEAHPELLRSCHLHSLGNGKSGWNRELSAPKAWNCPWGAQAVSPGVMGAWRALCRVCRGAESRENLQHQGEEGQSVPSPAGC